MSEWFLKEAEKFLDEARECGVNAFTITGGEPMLHRNFMDILTGIYERGMYVEEINTNGYFLRQGVLDQMKERGIRPLMKISFDGIGHHDWLRGRKGAEEDAIRAIRLCRASRQMCTDTIWIRFWKQRSLWTALGCGKCASSAHRRPQGGRKMQVMLLWD